MNHEQESLETTRPTYYLDTFDLVAIALFAALGGIFSANIGNIGRLVFGSTLPGGGQLFSGLHIFWYVLVFFLTNRKIGAVTLTGIIKGLVEIFSGNSLGILAFIIAVLSAIVFEICIILFRSLINTDRFQQIIIPLSAGLSSIVNILIQLEAFFGSLTSKGIPEEWIFVMLAFSFISGVFLAGYLGYIVYRLFENSNLIAWRKID